MKVTNLRAKAETWFCGHLVIKITYLLDGKPMFRCFEADRGKWHYSSKTCQEEPISQTDMDIATFILGGKPTLSQAKEALADPVNGQMLAQMRLEASKEAL